MGGVSQERKISKAGGRRQRGDGDDLRTSAPQKNQVAARGEKDKNRTLGHKFQVYSIKIEVLSQTETRAVFGGVQSSFINALHSQVS